MPDLPTTRAEALSLGLPYYFTGKPCKNGHVAERLASAGACVGCVREHHHQWRAANPEKLRERDRRYRESNRDKLREKVRQWSAANRDKRSAIAASRRAREINATPPWADLKAIESVYAERVRVTAETGIEHHVDHIVPLQGKSVCGLHVETNLRVIPAADNLAKGNKEIGIEAGLSA